METPASSVIFSKYRYLPVFFLTLLLIACEQTDKATAKNTNSANVPATVAETPADQSSTVEETPSSPTANDIANLSRAMHGAASQQPNDAPRDKHGNRYIIGDLGGVPVNLPPSVVHYVEYSDSPGFNPERLRNYNPPTRDYNSIIISFGFVFRNRDMQFLDREDRATVEAEKQARGEENDWADVSVTLRTEGSNPNLFDDIVRDFSRKNPYNPERPIRFHWTPTGEKQFGLEVYIHPGINPENGKPWREHERADDHFVFRAADGRVKTVIRCGNVNVINSCNHYFDFPPPMQIRIKLWYERAVLSQWRQFEENAVKLLYGFQK